VVAARVRPYGASVRLKTKKLKMKSSSALPLAILASTKRFALTTLRIALTVLVAMPDLEVILFCVFIGMMIAIVLIDKD
jgi:hypothetical protein